MARYLLLMAFSLSFQLLTAAPAYPKKTTVECAEGKWVSIYLCGDERCKYGRSEDGYTLLHDSIGWVYAEKNDEGLVGASEYRLVPYEDESEKLKDFKKRTEKGLQISHSMKSPQKIKSSITRAATNKSVVGEKRALVILMQFKDKKMTFAKEDFDRLFNEIGYSEDGAIGSVRDFYDFASGGKLDYITDIYGPYQTAYDMAYYGANTVSSNDQNPLAMAVEAIWSLPEDLDLSQYDTDGDNLVDNVHIIYAGYGEEAGASTNAIWAHEYPYVLPPTVNGMRFNSYSCSPEMRSNKGGKITRIGVICHELGHALGANDYYDTDYSTGGEYDGTGLWDLMASGSWNNDGISPAGFNPYVRVYDYGWAEATILQEKGTYTLSSNKIARIETGSDGDFYLLENRPQQYFDSSLPGGGLLIYHHHSNFDNHISSNDINSTHPQMFYPVCASSTEQTPMTNKEYGNINDALCEFTAAGKTSFSAKTVPSAFAWSGADVDFEIANIHKDADNNILFSLNDPADADDGDYDSEQNIVYKESFESGLNDFESVVVSGENNWRVYPNRDFFSDATLIPTACDGSKIALLYDGKRGSSCNATLESPQIQLSQDSSYVFSMFYQLLSLEGYTPTFTVQMESEGQSEIISKTFNTATSDWTNITISIPTDWDNFQYRLSGSFIHGGIFIDGITVLCTGNTANVATVEKPLDFVVKKNGFQYSPTTECIVTVVSIDGSTLYRRVVKDKTDFILPQGIYIVKINSDDNICSYKIVVS